MASNGAYLNPDGPSTGENSLRNYESEPVSPSGESYDESLAVPPSLSVINTEPSKTLSAFTRDTTDGREHDKKIPFSNVHNTPLKFKSVHRKVFIPGLEIQVKIIDTERSMTANLLNPNLYTILLTHGDFKWTVTKRYKHILSLHQQLTVFRAGLNIPFPSKSHRANRNSFRVNVEEVERAALAGKPLPSTRRSSNRVKKRVGALPRFPKKPEVLVLYDDLPKRIKQLEDYLYNLCNITIYRNHHELVKFLEVSSLSFIAELGPKGKEGMVLKRAGSTLPGQSGCDCCGLLHYGICNRCSYLCSSISCGKWRERWFFLKDTCFGYIRPRDGLIKSVMLFDQGFEVSSGMYSTGMGNGLQILNMSRQMVIRLWTKRISKEWRTHLNEVANSTSRDFTSPNPHHSYAPMRTATKACSFVDGAGYLSAVADCLEGAKEEIFITDWWLTPEIHLKRPAMSDYWRLDQILKRKAAQGVKVFILLFKEIELALGINSYYSKSQLNFANIKVIRHPDHAKAGVFLWAHHEKIVCIDQSIAFVGGIDLCYGRWDDHKHRLVDLGKASSDLTNRPKTKKKTSSSPGGNDDFVQVGSRMAFEDDESAVGRLAENSNETILGVMRTNSQDSTLHPSPDNIPLAALTLEPEPMNPLPILEPGDHLLMPNIRKPLPSDTVFLQDHYNPEFNHKKNVMDTIAGKGKDLLHMLGGDSPTDGSSTATDEREKRKAERYAASNKNLFFPGYTPESNVTLGNRMRLSDIEEDETSLSGHDRSVQLALRGMGEDAKLWMGKDYANFIVKDLVNLDSPFVDLVDRSTTPRMPWHDISVMVEGAAARDAARHFIQRWNAHKLEKATNNPSYPYLLPKSYTNIDVPDLLPHIEKYSVTCQLLRSLTCWSGGFVDTDTIEQSIHEAYVETITRAQHYIYIENQFFITLSNNSITVKNQIGEALYARILRAHKAGQVFRVFVVMPLLPAFEAEIGASSGISLHAITHWNYQSISRGNEALLNRLKAAGIPDPSLYITFHGLRGHSVLEGEPVTELIYVHSKLMIVDDRVVICGSANINDRSMLGKRDSEVAVIIQDENFEDGAMNGVVFPSGLYAGALRKRLFNEHLGLIDRKDLQRQVDLKDPISDTFYRDIWKATSRRNTETYENVFHCLPTDAVASFADLKKYQEENRNSMWVNDAGQANYLISTIKGHLVDFPLEFLVNEVLTPPNRSMEGMMPTSLWT